jgi:hypothetical protein
LTVAELIAELQKLDPALEVALDISHIAGWDKFRQLCEVHTASLNRREVGAEEFTLTEVCLLR